MVIFLHHAVQNGVRNGGVAHPGMPMLDRQLAGDDGGFVDSPVINDLQQVRTGLGINTGHTPIIQQQHIRLGQLNQPLAKRPVSMADTQFLSQAGYSLVIRRVSPPTRVLRQCTRQPGLARAGRTGDQHTVTAVNPVAQSQTHHRPAVHPASGAAIQILNAGLAVLQPCIFEQSGLTFVIALMHLTVHQQRQAFLKADGRHSSLGELLLQPASHTGQAQTAQLFNRCVHHHGCLCCWVVCYRCHGHHW